MKELGLASIPPTIYSTIQYYTVLYTLATVPLLAVRYQKIGLFTGPWGWNVPTANLCLECLECLDFLVLYDEYCYSTTDVLVLRTKGSLRYRLSHRVSSD
jgi:hypothetical protein